MFSLKFVAVLVVSLTLFVAPAYSQSGNIAANGAVTQKNAAAREAASNGSADDPHRQLQHELMARTIAERQSQLRLDTEKLVALAAELQQHVNQTNADILSLDVIKKAQEIQKLAKSVQDKMRNAY